MQTENHKIGIISLYYNNHNYGAQLQAYALVEFLSNHGFESEQICFYRLKSTGEKMDRLFAKIRDGSIWKWVIGKVARTILFRQHNQVLRSRAFQEFQQGIPHSESVYGPEDISNALKIYDGFICGSDQIWNMGVNLPQPEYMLSFVPSGRLKASYAASMPDINLTEEQRISVVNYLKDFTGVSVREDVTAEYLCSACGIDAKWVLDPTMLLDKIDWEKVSDESITELKDTENYIFCYFLGENKPIKALIKKFAKKRGLKLVTLPHLGKFKMSDLGFGDIELYDVSPRKFIALIKNADYVMTDSFHGSVFSYIFKTKFLCFERGQENNMQSRLYSILQVFNQPERYITDAQIELENLERILDLPWPEDHTVFERMKLESKEYLLGIIEKCILIDHSNHAV